VLRQCWCSENNMWLQLRRPSLTLLCGQIENCSRCKRTVVSEWMRMHRQVPIGVFDSIIRCVACRLNWCELWEHGPHRRDTRAPCNTCFIACSAIDLCWHVFSHARYSLIQFPTKLTLDSLIFRPLLFLLFHWKCLCVCMCVCVCVHRFMVSVDRSFG